MRPQTRTVGGWPYEPGDAMEPGAADPRRDSVPQRCTLTDRERAARAAKLRAEFLPRIVGLEEIRDGCIFWFERSEEDLRRVVDFVQVENECCGFLDFGIGLAAAGDRISLRISGPLGPGNFLTRAREALEAQQATQESSDGCECC